DSVAGTNDTDDRTAPPTRTCPHKGGGNVGSPTLPHGAGGKISNPTGDSSDEQCGLLPRFQCAECRFDFRGEGYPLLGKEPAIPDNQRTRGALSEDSGSGHGAKTGYWIK